MTTKDKVKKLVDLVTADGFVSAKSIDPYKEEKQYTWLKEVQEYLNNKHDLDIDLTHNAVSDKYFGIVFTKSGALVGDLYEPDFTFEYKEDALFYILTATLEYLNSPEKCARCDSHNTHIIRYGDNQPAYHCQVCGAITVENEMVGEIGIEPVRTQSTIDTLRGYVDRYSEPMTEGQRLYAEIARGEDSNSLYVTGVDPITPESTGQSVPANDLGTHLRWQTSEDFFSDQMAELNRTTPFDEAEDGSTQYSVGSTRRSRSNRLVPREVHELDLETQGLNNLPNAELINSEAYQRIIEETEAEIDRLYSSVGIARSRMAQDEALATMRNLAEQTGVIPINSTVNPNEDF